MQSLLARRVAEEVGDSFDAEMGKHISTMFAEAELNGDYADSATERMRIPFVEMRPSRVLSANDVLRRRFGAAVADAVLDEVAADG
jgi:hypothetical protein